MPIVFTCPRCDRKYSVSDALAGRRVTCKGCSQEFPVPGGVGPGRPSAFDDDEDDGPPIGMAPPLRTVSPAAYLPPRADPAPPPRAVARPAASGRSRGGGTPDWAPAAIKGAMSLAVIAAIGGGVWYVMNHGVPTVADIQNIGVSDKAREAVAVAKEYASAANEMADVLSRMNDAESARAAAPSVQAATIRGREVNAKLNNLLKTLSLSDEKHVKANAGADVRAALGRIKSEAQRISALPTRGNAFAMVQPIVMLDREIAQWGDREGSLTGNTADVAARKPVFVEATGLEDEAARAAFGEKLRQLAVGSGLISSALPGGGGRYQVEVSADAQAFSKQITFGTVTKVSGDTITVVATLTPQDIAAERDKIAVRQADEVRRKKEDEVRRKEDDERKKVDEARRLADIAANTPPPLETPVNPNAGPIDKAMADTRSNDRNAVQEAIRRLAWGVPEGRKGEVSRAVAPLALIKDEWTAREALKTLTALKSPEAVPTLLTVLGRETLSREAILALTEIRDLRAAEPLADRLEKDWPIAQEALIAIGPAAEPVVLAKLTDTKSRVRSLACEVLAKIGGKETLKTMLKLPADPDTFVRMAANDAMKKIVERVGPIPEMKAGAAKKGR